MTAPDAPKRQQRGDLPIIFNALSTLLLIALSIVVGWFVGSSETVPPAQHAAPASPVIVQQAPFPAELIAAARADVARATELAPTPTRIPTPPPTVQPWTFCIKGVVAAGQMCEWPQPPAPTPTPFPICGTPIVGDRCIWRES